MFKKEREFKKDIAPLSHAFSLMERSHHIFVFFDNKI